MSEPAVAPDDLLWYEIAETHDGRRCWLVCTPDEEDVWWAVGELEGDEVTLY